MDTKDIAEKVKPLRNLPVNDLFQVDFWVGDCFVTKDRRLIGALELDGYDADSLGPDEHFKMARLADSIYSGIPATVTVTQYYINYTGAKVSLKPRGRAYNDTLSKSRASFLNRQELTAGRLYQFFEINLNDDLNNLSPGAFINNVLGVLTDSRKREALRAKFSVKNSVILSRRDLNEKSELIIEVVDDVLSRWSMFMEGHRLSREHTTRVLSYLSSFRSETLSQNAHLPDRDGGSYLAQGDIENITVNNLPTLKFSSVEPTYARIASITSLGTQPMPGLWFLGGHSLGNQIGNFIVMFRFKRLSTFERSLMFESKENELAREQVSVMSMLTGKDQDYQEKQARMSKKHRDMFKELDEAKAQDVGWSNSQCMIVTFAQDRESLRNNSRLLANALENTGIKYVWEGVGLGEAYKTFFPTGGNQKSRRMKTSTRQNAVASLYYKPQEGQRYVEDLRDEALFILQTPSGRPFYFSPYVGGRGLVIGIGPTRSGKTYFKNTLAAHFLKYGGELVDIDIDPGSEIIAKSLGDDGAIFNVGGLHDEGGGFNLLSTSQGPEDQQFQAHLAMQLIRMLKANDEEGLQKLDEGEQQQLDNAILSTLKLGSQFHTLSHLVAHMPPRLRAKFKRWVKGEGGKPDGKYSAFSDSAVDAAGGLNSIHKVFNFQNIKSDPHLLSIAYPEVFYRIIRNFEDPAKRSIPKALQIDECHHPLKDDWFAEQVVTGAVTWNKYLVTLALWTQSPEQLNGIKKWDAVRTAASTLIFMADPNMKDELYKETFDITDGECAAIRSLRPRNEAYIIQRDLNISRKVILKNDPVMHATATSHPKEVPIRERLIDEHGFEKGIELAAVEIQKMGIDTTVDDSNSADSDKLLKNYYQ